MLVNNSTPSPDFSQTFILKAVKVLCFDAFLQVLIPEELFLWQDNGKSIGTGSAGRDRRDVPRISQGMIAQELRHVKDILQTARLKDFQ